MNLGTAGTHWAGGTPSGCTRCGGTGKDAFDDSPCIQCMGAGATPPNKPGTGGNPSCVSCNGTGRTVKNAPCWCPGKVLLKTSWVGGAPKLDSTERAVVDPRFVMTPITEQRPPSGKKCILGHKASGTASMGTYHPDDMWDHWAPLPVFPK